MKKSRRKASDRPTNTVPHSVAPLLPSRAGGLIIVILQRKRWREFIFPGVLLFTTLGIHLIHRPFWMYYYLQIAIPLAWFAGFGIAEGVSWISEIFSRKKFSLFSQETYGAIALCGLMGVTLVRSEGRMEENLKNLQRRERVDASPLLAKMKEYAPHTHWVYVQQGKEAYAFHAHLLMPPEIAVVSLKRFWSGQISNEKIIESCSTFKPEQLLFDENAVSNLFSHLLIGYTIMNRTTNGTLYVATDIAKRGDQ